PVVDELVRQRADRSLEHVFTLLALVFPRQPLQIAFRGLHTDDPLLHGTALEYLESILPPEIRRPLWPYLEDKRPKRAGPARSAEEVLRALVASSESIAIRLEELRRAPPRETSQGAETFAFSRPVPNASRSQSPAKPRLTVDKPARP